MLKREPSGRYARLYIKQKSVAIQLRPITTAGTAPNVSSSPPPFHPLIFRPHPSFLAGSPPLFGTRSITDSLVSRDGRSTPTSYYHSHKTSDTVRARLESERRRLNVATPGQKREEKKKAYGGTGGDGGGSGGVASAADNSTKPDMADLDQLTPELTELVSSLQAERVCASV